MRTFLAITLVAVLAASALAYAAPTRTNETVPAAAPTLITHHTLTSFDGTSIAFTVFQPGDATEENTAPLVLHSHGWSGSRAKTASGTLQNLLANGYGILSFDARGHGESGGYANVHNKDVEVHDFLALLDWAHDNLAWVTKQTDTGIENDILAGAIGGSYGGGYQLMTASYDDRLDALVPEITWNDLTYSLGTHGVIKSVWVDALYGAAKATGTRVSPDIDRWFLEVLATNDIPADAYAHFKGSSPIPADIQADVLLIQGIPDLLFNLNDAMRNYDALENGLAGDVRLVTHLSGHILPGIQPMALHQDRPSDLNPCGNIGQLTLAWFDEHLKGIEGAADAIPEVSYALEDGTCLATDAPTPATPAATFPALAAPQTGGTLLVPLLSGPATLAGIPHIAATATTPLTAKLNLGLVKLGPEGLRIVDDQSTGIRLTPGQNLDHDLAGVATHVAQGEQLLLRIDGLNEWYMTGGNRLPGTVALTDVTVSLPLVD